MILQTTDIKQMAQTVREYLKPKTLIGLSGAMGAGKTTFIAELFKNQNVDVASPTYALYHSYEAFAVTIYHVDLYRLETAAEIESAGYWDLFAETDSVILTEWIERLDPNDLPLDWVKYHIKIEADEQGGRMYTLT